MPLRPCPNEDCLTVFYDGGLSFEEHLAVSSHLRVCELCRERIGRTGRPLPAQPGKPLPQSRAETRALSTNLEDTLIDPLRLPKKVGPYRIRRMIGRGGMGTVYEAVHELLDRPVALKVLSGPAAEDPQFLIRFRREAKAVGRLHHPNVVQPMDAGEVGGVPFLAMELLYGTDMARLVRVLGPLAWADAAEVVRQAATALYHAHEKGLVHRDVKPSNLMLTSDGVIKLLDLGLALTMEAKTTGQEARLTGSIYLGTHDYMSPEQWLDPSTVDAKADVYALGCVFYHLLAGQAPFAGMRTATVSAKMRAHLDISPPSLTIVRQDLPAELAEIVAIMMTKSSADRPSAQAVVSLLQEFVATADLKRLAERCMRGPTIEFTDGDQTRPAPLELNEPAVLAPGPVSPPQVDSSPTNVLPEQRGAKLPASRYRSFWLAMMISLLCLMALVVWVAARQTAQPPAMTSSAAGK